MKPQASAQPNPAGQKIEKLTYFAGEIIFNQGETGDAAYLVDAGSVAIFQSVNGRRIELGIIKPGEIFGEMAVIDSGRRMASAVALTGCRISSIPRPLFERKLETADRFIRGLLSLFIKHIRSNHRTFLRRPRSYRDNIAVLEDISENIGFFAERLDGEHAEALNSRLKALNVAIGGLTELTATLPDSRHHAILETDEAYGGATAKSPRAKGTTGGLT